MGLCPEFRFEAEKYFCGINIDGTTIQCLPIKTFLQLFLHFQLSSLGVPFK